MARLVVLVGACVVAARALRRLLAPGWTGSLSWLADSVAGVALLVAGSEVLGTVGGFRFPALSLALWIVAGGLLVASAMRPPAAGPARPTADLSSPGALPKWMTIPIVGSTVGLVTAQWTGWIGEGLRFGIGAGGGPGNGDSLWYHMPFAASFVQSGWTSRLLFLNGEALVTYYPANTALLHAVGLLAMRTDFLSVFVNAALVPMALLAGWCVGSSRGVGAATLAGTAIALTLPVVASSEAGTAKDDVLGLVGLIAAVAFLVHPAGTVDAAHRRASSWYGGLAAGLAIGSKLTLVAPVGALLIAVVVLSPRGERVASGLRWGAGAVVTGGYWYARDLLRQGNPLPGLHLGLGSFRLPSPVTPSMDIYGSSLLHHLTDPVLWHRAFEPGLRSAFGAAWPLLLAALVLATVTGGVCLRRQELAPVVVTALATGAFLVTPGTVWGPQFVSYPGAVAVTEGLFAFNLRYLLPAVALGLAIVPLAVSRWRSGPVTITVFLGVCLVAAQLGLAGKGGWSGTDGVATVALGLAVTGGVVAVMLLRLGRARPLRRSSLSVLAGGLATAVLLAALAWPLQVGYRSDRFAAMPLATWAARAAPARIGYSGFVFSYPLYGAHLQNRVQMIGVHGRDGSWSPASSCAQWRRLIAAAHLEYVLVPVGGTDPIVGVDLARWRLGLPGGSPPDEPPESAWTRSDPELRPVFVGWGVAVYAVRGPLSLAGCPS